MRCAQFAPTQNVSTEDLAAKSGEAAQKVMGGAAWLQKKAQAAVEATAAAAHGDGGAPGSAQTEAATPAIGAMAGNAAASLKAGWRNTKFGKRGKSTRDFKASGFFDD